MTFREKLEKLRYDGVITEDEYANVIGAYVRKNKAYEDGLNDAWELALKYIKMGVAERKKIFHIHDCESFFGIFAPQEAIAKLKAYEEEIKVGDVVRLNNSKYTYVVTVIYEERGLTYYCGIAENGRWFAQRDVTKTGRHIDIEIILEQIRGE